MKIPVTYLLGTVSVLLLSGCVFSDRIPNPTLEERAAAARRPRPSAGELSSSAPVSTPDFERYRAATGVVAKMFHLGRSLDSDASVYVVARTQDPDTGAVTVRVLDRGALRSRRGDNALVMNYPTVNAPHYVFGGTVIDSPPEPRGVEVLSQRRAAPGVVVSACVPGEGLVLPKYVYERIFLDGFEDDGRPVSIECCVIEGAKNSAGLSMSEVLTEVLRALEREPVKL